MTRDPQPRNEVSRAARHLQRPPRKPAAVRDHHHRALQGIRRPVLLGQPARARRQAGNELILLDWKCANAVYADYLYQLAAYGLLWNENYPDHPPVGGFHLCRFAKEQGDFSHHYFPALDDEAETFLLMRDLFDRVKKAERRLR